MEPAIHLQLKRARESRALSLEDVSHETRIPVAKLVALESGDFAGFGSMAYARSFLRSYCGYLGVDGEDAVLHLPKPILGGEHDYQYLTKTHGPWLRGARRLATPQQIQAEAAAGRSVTGKASAMIALISCACIAWAFYVGGTKSAEAARKVKEAQKSASDAARSRRSEPSNAPVITTVEEVRPVALP
jgi:hypothetical protein